VPLEKVGRGADVGIRRESMVRDGGDDAFDGDGTDQRGLRDGLMTDSSSTIYQSNLPPSHSSSRKEIQIIQICY